MGIWSDVFEVRKKEKHTVVELTEKLWNDNFSCPYQSCTMDGYHFIAVKNDDKKWFWVETVEIHHEDYAVKSGLICAKIGDFIELTDKGLILWSKDLFEKEYIRVETFKRESESEV